MNELFSLDRKDYDPSWPVFSRHSARGIIARGNKILMIYSQKYKYYKFPGGGINEGEKPEDALQREILEESGYRVIPESIREYGYVPRRQKDCMVDGIFIQNNYYYFCSVSDERMPQNLDDYEQEEGFTPQWVEPMVANSFNRHNPHGEADPVMIKRDTKVMDMIDLVLRTQQYSKEEDDWIKSLGESYFSDMIDYVGNRLGNTSGTAASKLSINYSRFEHIKRVLGWTLRLYKLNPNPDAIDYNTVVTATIFHDVGYNDADENTSHAEAGALITRKYLEDKCFDPEFIDRVCYLVERHSDKWMMDDPDIAPDLLLLMEADLLDDMGALGVIMDCMIEQATDSRTTFKDSLNHIARYTLRQQHDNPMRSPAGRELWESKTALVEQFYSALEKDLKGWK